MNKTVLITGSSRGIGASTARLFAQNGYNIIINYNTNKYSAIKLSEELKNTYKVKTLVIKCDISKEDEVKEMTNKSIEEFKHIDVLVNNASIAIDTFFEDKTADNFRKILDTNLIGTFLVSKYIGNNMFNHKSGVIINISSTNAIDTNYVESLDYDASKAGVISLTNNLANAYAPYVRVNTVAPGWVNTDMTKDLDDKFRMKECNKILMQRFANAEEIANVIYFLASDKASYINSSIIRVDGGKYV